MNIEKVAVLGASDNPDRYSYKAFKMLLENNHKVFLVSPRLKEVEGHKVESSLKELSNIDTLTLYVNKSISSSIIDEIIELKPKRVIFNPGTENEELSLELNKAGIQSEEACTLVLLRNGQF
ncbi:MAG: putative CoA-binding protein [Bacteriovoracaceae bacterium]|jgi:predicted CoA-binding protein